MVKKILCRFAHHLIEKHRNLPQDHVGKSFSPNLSKGKVKRA
jgi:hypothetical protein